MIAALLCILAAPPQTEAAAPAPSTLAEVLATITVEEIDEHVAFFAAPECAGRATGSPGFERAAARVEAELARLGLEPAGRDGGWRLPFPLESLVAEKCALALASGPNEGVAWQPDTDFVPLLGSAEGFAAGAPIFAGFAIDAKNERWQDLSAKKVQGKVVFAFTREPFADDPRSKRFEGLEATPDAKVHAKARAVAAAGGVALVLVPDPGAYPLDGEPLGGVVPMPLGRGMSLDRMREGRGQLPIPVVSASRAVADAIFGTPVAELWHAMEKSKKPKLLEPKRAGLRVEVTVAWEAKQVDYFNLAARLPGSDGDGEVVVLGAHLDHVGPNYVASELWGGGRTETHPGADDNASGSAALLEVAEALAGTKPREDLLFLWFAGEELGLLGSQAYCEAPLVPHEKTLVMLNMDQIGRTDPKEFSIGGAWDQPVWEKLLKKAHKASGSRIKIDFDSGRDLYARSDQYSFFQKGVTALFFFEGHIEDNPVYHQPGDTAASFDGAKSCEVAKVFAAVCHAVAYEGERP